jgi:hypothetical protein
VHRLAERLLQRYAKHPALFAVGYNNEAGNGLVSYSEADRLRFIAWLKRKYGSLDALNTAWATQRWSRRINAWDEVRLPYIDGPGPYERYLDMRRFWSDATIAVLRDLDAVRRRFAPDKPAISNLWDSAWRKGFDMLATYRDYVSYGAMGFYPGEPLGAAFEATMMRAGMTAPIWFNEFTAGGPGYYGTRGRSRMWAHFGLLLGAQAVLPWTWQQAEVRPHARAAARAVVAGAAGGELVEPDRRRHAGAHHGGLKRRPERLARVEAHRAVAHVIAVGGEHVKALAPGAVPEVGDGGLVGREAAAHGVQVAQHGDGGVGPEAPHVQVALVGAGAVDVGQAHLVPGIDAA